MDAKEIFEKLSAPFMPQDIDWRIGQAGETKDGKVWCKVLAYLNARSVMDRLDDVVGPLNWRPNFEKAPNDPEGKSVLCLLELRIDGEWIGKSDAATNSDIEPVKGGISDSLKRAAVHWGIGRYLYGLTDTWGVVIDKKEEGAHYANCKIKVDGKEKYISFWWLPPKLPEWAMPPMASEKPERKMIAAEKAAHAAMKPEAKKPAKGEVRNVPIDDGKEDPRKAVSAYSDAMARLVNFHGNDEQFAKMKGGFFDWLVKAEADKKVTDDQAKALTAALSKIEDARSQTAAA